MLGEVIDYEQPGKYIIKSKSYDDNYKVPVLTAGQTFILGYTSEITGIYNSSPEIPVIIFDDFTTSFHWVDFDFKVKSSALKILTKRKHDKKIIFRYVYFFMKTINYNSQEHARQWIGKYSKIKIPIPPLEIQQKIATILDKFDTLVNDLTHGLPAEIQARKQQYEHYRNRLLTFKEKKVA